MGSGEASAFAARLWLAVSYEGFPSHLGPSQIKRPVRLTGKIDPLNVFQLQLSIA